MAMRPRGGGVGPNRPAGRTTTVRPVYETFTPVFQRQQDEEAEKLLIYLPGFLKENIKVSTEGKTTLKVRGERLIGNNKWNRFLEEFQAPEGCNMREIRARFENGILTITMPIAKKIPPPVTTQQEAETTTTLQKQPYIPPFLRTKDDHSPPLLAPETTPDDDDDDTQKQPPKVDFPPKIISQPTLLKAADDPDEDISQKETTPPPPPPKEAFQQKPLYASDDESQKKAPAALGPMFPKDYYQDESPPPSVLAAAKHGDQKSLEDQEKMMKPLIGLKDFVEGEKISSSEVTAKGTITQTLFDGRNKTSAVGVDEDEQKKEQSVKQTSMTTTDPKEERQLLVNAGVAVLVILALGAYIYNTVGTRKSD